MQMFMEIYVTLLSAVNHVLTRKVCDPGAWISRSLRELVLGAVDLLFYFRVLHGLERLMLLLIQCPQALGYEAVFVVRVWNLSTR